MSTETGKSAHSGRHPRAVHLCVEAARASLRRAGVRRGNVVVAVSGGGDSMALLEIAGLLAPEFDLLLHVASVDHGIREGSRGDVERAREAAERWKAGFHPLTISTTWHHDENSLRNARYDELERVRHKLGARYVLVGHSADDQIETIVFRFLRGAGLGGLAGMREVRGSIVRPLLGLRRQQLRDLLEAREVAWSEDPTNSTYRYARGRLRSAVLPAIAKAFGRGALDHLLDVAPRWREDEDYLEDQAARVLAAAVRRDEQGRPELLDATALCQAPAALRARALRQWIHAATGRTPGSRDIAAIERWLNWPGPKGSLDVAGATVEADAARRLRVFPSEFPLTLDPSPGSGKAKAVLPASEGRVRFPRG